MVRPIVACAVIALALLDSALDLGLGLAPTATVAAAALAGWLGLRRPERRPE